MLGNQSGLQDVTDRHYFGGFFVACECFTAARSSSRAPASPALLARLGCDCVSESERAGERAAKRESAVAQKQSG